MTGDVVMTDHKNRLRNDNRFENLRPSSYSQNGANRKCTSVLGVKGVAIKGTKFMAQITYNYKNNYLGLWDSLEEAHAAYLQAAMDLWGEFACG
jgi:hypothetical protein